MSTYHPNFFFNWLDMAFFHIDNNQHNWRTTLITEEMHQHTFMAFMNSHTSSMTYILKIWSSWNSPSIFNILTKWTSEESFSSPEKYSSHQMKCLLAKSESYMTQETLVETWWMRLRTIKLLRNQVIIH